MSRKRKNQHDCVVVLEDCHRPIRFYWDAEDIPIGSEAKEPKAKEQIFEHKHVDELMASHVSKADLKLFRAQFKPDFVWSFEYVDVLLPRGVHPDDPKPIPAESRPFGSHPKNKFVLDPSNTGQKQVAWVIERLQPLGFTDEYINAVSRRIQYYAPFDEKMWRLAVILVNGAMKTVCEVRRSYAEPLVNPESTVNPEPSVTADEVDSKP